MFGFSRRSGEGRKSDVVLSYSFVWLFEGGFQTIHKFAMSRPGCHSFKKLSKGSYVWTIPTLKVKENLRRKNIKIRSTPVIRFNGVIIQLDLYRSAHRFTVRILRFPSGIDCAPSIKLCIAERNSMLSDVVKTIDQHDRLVTCISKDMDYLSDISNGLIIKFKIS